MSNEKIEGAKVSDTFLTYGRARHVVGDSPSLVVGGG